MQGPHGEIIDKSRGLLWPGPDVMPRAMNGTSLQRHDVQLNTHSLAHTVSLIDRSGSTSTRVSFSCACTATMSSLSTFKSPATYHLLRYAECAFASV